MKLWKAIVLTIVVACFLIYVATVSVGIGKSLAYLVWIISALYVDLDARKIHPEKYKSMLGLKANSLAVLTFLFWVVMFPAYLGFRYRIKNGLVPLRELQSAQV